MNVNANTQQATAKRRTNGHGQATKATVVDEPIDMTAESSAVSAKRTVAATIVWVLTYGAVAYNGWMLVEIAVAAAAVYTTSQFLLFMAAFVGFLVVLMLAASSATYAHALVMEFDVRRITKRIGSYRERFDAWNQRRRDLARARAVADMEDALRGGL